MLGRDPGALVLDADDRACALDGAVYVNDIAGAARVGGVGQEIRHDLRDLTAIDVQSGVVADMGTYLHLGARGVVRGRAGRL